MKLYTIKNDSTFLAETNESQTLVTTETPIILTEDIVVYEGSCSDTECGCETVNFQLPSVRYYVDRSDVVVSEFVLSQ